MDEEEDGRFEQGEVSQASLHLAAVRLTPVQNTPGRRFQVRMTLGCALGRLDVTDPRRAYTIRLLQCHASLVTTFCEIDVETGYGYRLPKADIELIESRTSKEARSWGWNVSARIAGAAKALMLGNASLDLGGKYARQADKDWRSTASIRQDVTLIGWDLWKWTVGDHVFSDPRRGGFLNERYFNETPGTPLCAIDVVGDPTKAEVKAQVRVQFGQLDVRVLDALGKEVRPIKTTEAEEVEWELKARLMGIAIAKAERQRQLVANPDLSQSEFVLAEHTLTAIMPASSRPMEAVPSVSSPQPGRRREHRSKAKP